MKKYSYNKYEKLKNENEISLLFEKGKWKRHKRINIAFVPIENRPSKVGVSVSKRYFKRAVDRNRIKRLLREVYRNNKEIFQQAFGQNVLAMLFWVSNKKPLHYSDVEDNFLKLCKDKIETSS